MSAPISGTLHQNAASHNLPGTSSAQSHAMASSAGASGDSSTITANDFLTLLVTEMKNQDPTANTDPNEYINQLVQVNSLQQLISINQTLTSESSASGNIVREPAAQQVASVVDLSTHATVPASTVSVGRQTATSSMLTPVVEGNLTIPLANPAATRVANSLTLPPTVR